MCVPSGTTMWSAITSSALCCVSRDESPCVALLIDSTIRTFANPGIVSKRESPSMDCCLTVLPCASFPFATGFNDCPVANAYVDNGCISGSGIVRGPTWTMNIQACSANNIRKIKILHAVPFKTCATCFITPYLPVIRPQSTAHAHRKGLPIPGQSQHNSPQHI